MDLPSDSGGYIRLHRCFLEHPIWTSCSRHVREVGLVCVLRANWKDGRWWNNHRRELIEVKRSQWATSIEKIQQACPKGTSTKQVRTAIVTLEKLGFLGKQTGKGFTLITICNYDKWNPPGSENGNQSGAARARQGQDKGNNRRR